MSKPYPAGPAMTVAAFAPTGVVDLTTVYMVKALVVDNAQAASGKQFIREAYNRHYAFLGLLSHEDYATLWSASEVRQTTLDYTGGRTDQEGDAVWLEPKATPTKGQ